LLTSVIISYFLIYNYPYSFCFILIFRYLCKCNTLELQFGTPTSKAQPSLTASEVCEQKFPLKQYFTLLPPLIYQHKLQ